MQSGEKATDLQETEALPASGVVSTLCWTFSMNELNRGRTAPAVVALCLSSFAAFALFHSILIAGAVAALVFGSIAEAILPLTYCLDPEHASVKVGALDWLEMPWSDVQSVYSTRHGLKLSVFAMPQRARLEAMRGIHLRFPEQMRKQIVHFVSASVETR